jgi:L-threonylcarbamoyladenylate synthase
MNELDRAVAALRAGDLVAFPTETVYGLGADARSPVAVAKVFAAKGRPADHPLIVHLPDATHLSAWAINVPDAALKLAAVFWPGPLTLILQRGPGVPDAVTGGQNTVGLRVPNHPLALELLRAFGGGIAAPSANRFGRISPTTAAHVEEELSGQVAMILDGGSCAVGIESTILDMSRSMPEILRPGAITAAEIERVTGVLPASPGVQGSPRVSGSMEAHYAPRTPLRLVSAEQLEAQITAALTEGRKIAVLAFGPELPCHPAQGLLVWRQAAIEPASYAHDLYAKLRELDHTGCSCILVQRPDTGEAWRAVNDRLQRSATGSGQP